MDAPRLLKRTKAMRFGRASRADGINANGPHERTCKRTVQARVILSYIWIPLKPQEEIKWLTLKLNVRCHLYFCQETFPLSTRCDQNWIRRFMTVQKKKEGIRKRREVHLNPYLESKSRNIKTILLHPQMNQLKSRLPKREHIEATQLTLSKSVDFSSMWSQTKVR